MDENVPFEIKPALDRAAGYEAGGHYAEAVKVLEEAIADHPEMAVLYNNIGCSLANLGRNEEARVAFARAITLTSENRKDAVLVPKTYPEEPAQNLRSIIQRIEGNTQFVPPARTPDSRPALDFVRPGIGYPAYVLFFIMRSVFGVVLSLIAVVFDAWLWRSKSPYYPQALGASCILILVSAFLAYRSDPRLRRQRG